MDARTREAVRYLGFGRNAVDEQTEKLISEAFAELDRIARPKAVHRIFPCVQKEDEIQIGSMKVHSKNLAKNLQGCTQTVLMATTLGIEVDLAMHRYTLTDMAKVVIFQACAAAVLEEFCDQCQEQIADEMAPEYKGMRPRFSPGYGDFDIHHQEDILRMLEAHKKIGLSMTESYMLTPTKSVTALIGFAEKETGCPKSGCEACEKKDCIYRRT